jgi:excisionase family DNA binding protein
VDLDELQVSRAAVVTVAQAASVFGVDVRTVTRAIENGELPAVRLGRRVLIPRLPLLTALGVRVDDALTDDHDASSGDRGASDPAWTDMALPQAHAAAPGT